MPLVPDKGTDYRFVMQIIARRTLRAFWLDHPRAEQPLRDWYAIISKAEWASPADAKAIFGKSVDIVGDNRLIFGIRRNEYRLIVHVAYAYRRVHIKFVGTHAQYDRVDPETV